MSFKISKSVPLPKASSYTLEQCPYPFKDMGIGDSFLIPIDGYLVSKHRSSVYSWQRRFRRFTGLRDVTFTCKEEPEGLRVWRTR
jgi:hypothetical protein